MKQLSYAITGIAVCICLIAAMPAHAAQADPFVIFASGAPFGGLEFIGIAGMLVNKDALDSVFTGLKTLFNQSLKEAPTAWQDTTMVVQSGGAGEDYAWLSRWGKMRKWVGDKYIKVLKAGKYYKKNEDFEVTITVDRNDIKDDRLGIYNNQAQAAGESSGELERDISDDLKNNGFTETCIDGQLFYDTDHEADGASVSNKGTKALSAATLAAATASYGVARQAILEFTDDEGEPLKLMPDVLEYPPALEAQVKILLENEKLSDGAPNPYRGTAKGKMNPGLTSTTAWFLHVTGKKSIKPFIVQMREAPHFVSQTSMESEGVFMQRKYLFGAEARATGVYGPWQLSYGSDGTT